MILLAKSTNINNGLQALLVMKKSNPRKLYRRVEMEKMMFFTLGLLVLFVTPNHIEARLPFLRSKPISNGCRLYAIKQAEQSYFSDIFEDSDDDYDEIETSEILDSNPTITTIISRTRTTNSPPKPLSQQISTKLGDLIPYFRESLIRKKEQYIDNAESEQVHVGKLLFACQRLENTMRNIGMTQSANDLAGNIAKVEDLYRKANFVEKDSMSKLLQWELDSGLHGRGSQLKIRDKSGTMGFLWLGRNLRYQYDMYKLMLEENKDPLQAAKIAYEKDLQQHLSWPMQKMFQAALPTLTPPKQSILFAQMGGFPEESYGKAEDEATRRDLHQILDTWQPLLHRMQHVFSDLELDDI